MCIPAAAEFAAAGSQPLEGLRAVVVQPLQLPLKVGC
jgi:hypothetical protein